MLTFFLTIMLLFGKLLNISTANDSTFSLQGIDKSKKLGIFHSHVGVRIILLSYYHPCTKIE